MTPCNYINDRNGFVGDTVSEECIPDLKAQTDYLGPLDILVYYNDEEFDQQEFGEESIL